MNIKTIKQFLNGITPLGFKTTMAFWVLYIAEQIYTKAEQEYIILAIAAAGVTGGLLLLEEILNKTETPKKIIKKAKLV